MGQSIVLREIKEEVPLENDTSSHQNLLSIATMSRTNWNAFTGKQSE